MDTIKNQKIVTFPDADDMFHGAAKDFLARVQAAVIRKGVFNVVLSGGNTPKKYFEVLVSEPYCDVIPWDKIHFYFGDERFVVVDDESNNYHMACQFLFSKIPVPKDNIHRIPTTECDSPEKAASEYEQTIQNIEFDLMYLGLGDNSHTASLMPGTDLVKSYVGDVAPEFQKKLVAALWVEELNMYRISLTPPAINGSNCIHYMAAGADKAQAIWNVLEGPENPVEFPAQLIQHARGEIFWFIDQAAATNIQSSKG